MDSPIQLVPNNPSQNRIRSSLPTLYTANRPSFSMLHESTTSRSTGSFWCAIQLFVITHGLGQVWGMASGAAPMEAPRAVTRRWPEARSKAGASCS